jgi:hypothetical protein
MPSRPFALTRTEQVLLLVCASWLASAALYAFIASELFPAVRRDRAAEPQRAGGRLLSGLRDYPLIFLLSWRAALPAVRWSALCCAGSNS